jgi:anti-anti-sigma factor
LGGFRSLRRGYRRSKIFGKITFPSGSRPRLVVVVEDGPGGVIADLADLAYIDCSSLAVLVGAREQAQLAGGDVLLAGPRGVVARLLLLTGRAGEFSVFPSVSVAAFSAGLVAFGIRLAAAKREESVAAVTEGMVTAAGIRAAVT